MISTPETVKDTLGNFLAAKSVTKSRSVIPITKTHLFKYIENFASKTLKFSDKKL